MAITWTIDPIHSELVFKVKHLMISMVTGTFREFSGTMITESESFEGAAIQFDAYVKSIDTRAPDRDEHLRSPDFFYEEKFPLLHFESTLFREISSEGYELTGNITIRDITRPIRFDVEYGGTVKDQAGQTRAGFEVTGAINRKDFGLAWNAVTEAGGMLVGEEVKLSASIELVKNA